MKLLFIFFIALATTFADDAFIDASELKKNLKNSIVIDVCDGSFYKKGHIDGSINVDVQSFLYNQSMISDIDKINKKSRFDIAIDKTIEKELQLIGINKNSKVVIYNHNTKDSIYKSAFLAFILTYSGVNNVKILDGGYLSLVFENKELISKIDAINLFSNIKIEPQTSIITTDIKDNQKVIKAVELEKIIKSDYTIVDKATLKNIFDYETDDEIVVDANDIYEASLTWYLLYKNLGYKKSKILVK